MKTLFRTPAPTPTNLRPRQQLVWQLVRETPGGITADEAGALAHAHRVERPHSVDERCEFCATDGRSILASKALKPLVVKRRGTNKYECRNPAHRAGERVQVGELAGETFEEIFG